MEPRIYIPTAQPGDTRRRVFEVQISNPSNGRPRATFVEQEVILTKEGGEKVVTQRTRVVAVDYTPGASFPLIDPATRQPLGATMTHDQLMVALFSLGAQAQEAQDAADLAAEIAEAERLAAKLASELAEAERLAAEAAALKEATP